MPKYLDANFRRLSDLQFLAKTGIIYVALSTNPAFAGPWPCDYPSLTELKAFIDRYRERCRLAADKDALNIALKKEARAELHETVYKLAEYAEKVAGKNPVELLKTGFSLKQRNVKRTKESALLEHQSVSS